jgi:Uma2 family endonuclease
MAFQTAKRLFTVEEYQRMGEAGILAEDERVELIEGEIVRMSPIGKDHAACVKRIIALFSPHIGRALILGVQDPIDIGAHSELQPDISVLRPRADFYKRGHPGPADILLLMEVSDATLKNDRAVKLPLYAQAGIPEVWVINLPNDLIEVYTQPGEGGYQVVQQARRQESLAVQGVPGLTLSITDILG